MRKRFHLGVNVQRTKSFLGADIRSDHDLVIVTVRVRLKKTKSQPIEGRFDLEKLRNSDVTGTFQATTGPLINMRDDDIDIDIDSMITTYSSVVIDIANMKLGRNVVEKKLGQQRCSRPL